jgi:hypothetical protein
MEKIFSLNLPKMVDFAAYLLPALVIFFSITLVFSFFN